MESIEELWHKANETDKDRFCELYEEDFNKVKAVKDFNVLELRNVLRKVKTVTIEDNFEDILIKENGEIEYDNESSVEFLDNYKGKTVKVYEWCNSWWICEEDNHPLIEDCFIEIP